MLDHSHRTGRFCFHPSQMCRLGTVLPLIISFCIIEMICGHELHSMAILADAIHMVGDSGGLIIAMGCIWISKRKSTRNTYGWIRAQELGALANCILLISLCMTIFIQALKRMIVLEPIEPSRLKLYILVGFLGLCINVIALFVLGGDLGHGHSHGGSSKTKPVDADRLEMGEGEESWLKTDGDGHCHAACEQEKKKKKKKHGMDGGQMNIHGAFLHVLTDALGSVIVIIAGLAIRQWPKHAWVNYIDPIASLLMVSLIVSFTIPLLRASASVLLQTTPPHIEVADLQKRLVEEVPGVLGVHELHIWRLSGSKFIATAHIRCDQLSEYMTIAEDVKNFFHHQGIHSTTVQPEFIEMEHLVDKPIGHEECVLECSKDCSVNTCCGQPSTFVKRSVNPAARQPNDSSDDESQTIFEQ